MSFFFNGGSGFPFGMGGDPFEFASGGQGKPKKDVNTTKYYEILGVAKTATTNEIRKAYLKLAKTKHPDKGGNEEEFQELQQAYETLSDEGKRKIYDTYGEEGIQEGRDGNEGVDIFDMLNGRGGRQKGKRKTKSVLKQLPVSWEDIYLGKEKFLEIERYRICTKCKGSGSKVANANTNCPGCDGKGIKMVVQRTPFGIMQTQQECPCCNGEGYVIKEKDKCPGCKGQKVSKQSTMIKVMLDKGAPDGKRYTFAGESDEIPDYEPGDVIIEIKIENNKKFTRKGADLVYNTDISLLEALTGFEMVFTHLDGRKIWIKTKPGEIIKPGILKTVKECGMPFYESPFRFGHLYINFNIIFPTKLDEKQKQDLKVLFPSADNTVDEGGITEKYTLVEYNEKDDNTYATGGKSKRKRSMDQHGDQDDDEEDERRGGARNVQCANQ